MSQDDDNKGDNKKKDEQIRVKVHYMAAKDPFEQDFAPTATVGNVKTAALTGLGLSEGSNQEGNTVVYTLYDKKDPLENMAVTVGQLAGDHKTLQLKLTQQITQG